MAAPNVHPVFMFNSLDLPQLRHQSRFFLQQYDWQRTSDRDEKSTAMVQWFSSLTLLTHSNPTSSSSRSRENPRVGLLSAEVWLWLLMATLPTPNSLDPPRYPHLTPTLITDHPFLSPITSRFCKLSCLSVFVCTCAASNTLYLQHISIPLLFLLIGYLGL